MFTDIPGIFCCILCVLYWSAPGTPSIPAGIDFAWYSYMINNCVRRSESDVFFRVQSSIDFSWYMIDVRASVRVT